MTPDEQGLPSRLLASSAGLGWRSVDAMTYADPPRTDGFRTRSPRLLLVLVTGGRYQIESRHGPSWHRATYRPGSVGISAPGNPSELRWRGAGRAPMTSLHLHLDPAAAGETVFPDGLTLHDDYVTASARALAHALARKAPALYADALAAGLVAHLAHHTRPPGREQPRTLPLSDTEVTRVTDYMRAHLADDISVDDLATVANVSKFHFIRAFAQTTGTTPARHLRRMRLQAGADLLRTTALSVSRIAVLCGYRSAGQFAAAFRAEFTVSPTGFRNPP